VVPSQRLKEGLHSCDSTVLKKCGPLAVVAEMITCWECGLSALQPYRPHAVDFCNAELTELPLFTFPSQTGLPFGSLNKLRLVSSPCLSRCVPVACRLSASHFFPTTLFTHSLVQWPCRFHASFSGRVDGAPLRFVDLTRLRTDHEADQTDSTPPP
jgi:hypothetical protein